MALKALTVEHAGIDLEKVGMVVLRYGLAVILLWVGGLKFTEYEAKGIEPLVANSPFPVLSANIGQFIIKDLVLLGTAVWTAGEALRAARGHRVPS